MSSGPKMKKVMAKDVQQGMFMVYGIVDKVELENDKIAIYIPKNFIPLQNLNDELPSSQRIDISSDGDFEKLLFHPEKLVTIITGVQ